ncbi:MAG: PEP-CTERM sorting domain-containing protein [Cyanobacteria bacterium P01_H01_bin.35]
MKTTKTNNSKSIDRLTKHFLSALGGATVSTLSILSSTSAQAASFVTTFDTVNGNVTLEWSGEDANNDGEINSRELSGSMTVEFNGVRYELGSVADFETRNFSFIGVNELPSSQISFIEVGFSGGDVDSFYLEVDSSVRLFQNQIVDTESGVELEPIFRARFNPDGSQTTRLVGGPTTAVTTPEPSLTLGFITLGGLMLGSKRKRKA